MPDEITWIGDPVAGPSALHRQAARVRQSRLAKPQGALGVLEEIVVTLAGLQRTELPGAASVPVVVFAADHGVAVENVSAFRPAETVAMLATLVSGGAAIAVMARELGLKLSILDVGTLAESPVAGVITDKPCCGTRDIATGAAMTAEEVAHALAAGRRAVMRVSAGADLVVLGEVGIANTTAATAVAAALLDLPVLDLIGAGTRLDESAIAHKADVVGRALAVNGLAAGEAPAMEVLARVGGLEIVALTGAIIAAAQMGLPVLVDGYIVTVAALAACRLVPRVRDWLIFSHASSEHGHARVLTALEARPIATLGMHHGEGTGAVAVLPLVRLACALHRGMAVRDEIDGSPPPAN